MAYPSDRRISGTDDYLSDELPDYSSRRSSYNGGDQRDRYDVESDRKRKVSTASNMLEVPGLSSRHNSMGSTSSLVSSSSVNSFSYRIFGRPKVKNTFGCVLALIGLCLLVLGILLLIFGSDTTSVDSPVTNDGSTDTNTNTTTNANNNSNDINANTSEFQASPLTTIGYFALFSGILLILIAISIISVGCKPRPITVPKPIIINNNTQRRVSTIEIETPINSTDSVVNKPEIMITPDNVSDDVSYKKFPVPLPQITLIPRPSVSSDDSNSGGFTAEYHKRYF